MRFNPDKKGIMILILIILGIIFILIGCLKLLSENTDASGLYSEEEAKMMAKTVWGEARGLNEYEQSLVAWCILNRFDHGGFGTSIKAVISAQYQFQGYKESFPVDEDILRLCKDVLYRWENETEGRTLPKEYLYFYGDGRHNYYTTEYQGGETYDFSLPNPYGTERGFYYCKEELIMPENFDSKELVEIAKAVIGSVAEITAIYRAGLDNTKLDEATKLALTIDFQRTFMASVLGKK